MVLSKKYAVLFFCLAVSPMFSWQQGIPQLVLSEYQIKNPNTQGKAQPINQFLALLSVKTQRFIDALYRSDIDRNTLDNIINIRRNIFNTLHTATRSPQGLMDMLKNLVENVITPLNQQLAIVERNSSRLILAAPQLLTEYQNAIKEALPAISTVAQDLSASFNIADTVSDLVKAALQLIGKLLGNTVQLPGGVLEGAGRAVGSAGKTVGGATNALGKALNSVTGNAGILGGGGFLGR